MDFATAAVSIVGPVITKALTDVWNDWRNGRRARKGMKITETARKEVPTYQSGIINFSDAPPLESPYFEAPQQDAPPSLLVSGEFVFEETLYDYMEDWLHEREKVVLSLIVDHDTREYFLGEFDFTGYAVTLWNGNYSFYVFIIDPYNDELLGIGYPIWNEFQDPNPISFEGEGHIELNICIFPPEILNAI